MNFKNLPKEKHKTAISLFRSQKINKLKELFKEYKVSSCSSFFKAAIEGYTPVDNQEDTIANLQAEVDLLKNNSGVFSFVGQQNCMEGIRMSFRYRDTPAPPNCTLGSNGSFNYEADCCDCTLTEI